MRAGDRNVLWTAAEAAEAEEAEDSEEGFNRHACPHLFTVLRRRRRRRRRRRLRGFRQAGVQVVCVPARGRRAARAPAGRVGGIDPV